MAILHVDHPDIIEFITAKEFVALQNFNLSVGLTKEFMTAVERGGQYNLRNPRTGKVVGSMDASRVLDLIATMAWKNADPGILFLTPLSRRRTGLKLPVPAASFRYARTRQCAKGQ